MPVPPENITIFLKPFYPGIMTSCKARPRPLGLLNLSEPQKLFFKKKGVNYPS